MKSRDPLHGLWLKLDRAKGHVDDLRTEVHEATSGDPKTVQLGHRFDKDTEKVEVYAERIPEIRSSYGLLVGDAIHNFRGVLDHMWWQLAVNNLGRQPTDDEAKEIQFPILSDVRYRSEVDWRGHRFLKHVGARAGGKAKVMQPFNPRDPNVVHLLELLAELSNVDKHRSINVAVVLAHEVRVGVPTVLIDCDPKMFPDLDGSSAPQVEIIDQGAGHTMAVGDPIVRIPVIPTGPNPDVELDVDLSCFIALTKASGETLDMFETLDSMGVLLAKSVRAFRPLL